MWNAWGKHTDCDIKVMGNDKVWRARNTHAMGGASRNSLINHRLFPISLSWNQLNIQGFVNDRETNLDINSIPM